ncbi:hypothetical protein [Streptomyces albicerus]|uniref:hypothetical protein n=1 Tax=Streptomyces albicerus TaxID=2569859 RepID=UPI001CED99ED|nr:hypothetical protein [Streptomyces albicerus]
MTQLDIGAGFEGGLSVVILAIFLDRVTGSLGTPRPRPARPLSRSSRRRTAKQDREPEVAAVVEAVPVGHMSVKGASR